jgi:hypothetical protein
MDPEPETKGDSQMFTVLLRYNYSTNPNGGVVLGRYSNREEAAEKAAEVQKDLTSEYSAVVVENSEVLWPVHWL